MAERVAIGEPAVVGAVAGAGAAEVTPSRPRHPLVGLGVALASAAAFATSGAFGKSLLVGGWSPGAVVTMRITLAAVVLLVPALWSLRGRWPALRRNAWVVVGYGLTGVAGCQLAYFNAVTHLSVGVALLLEYLAPVLIVGWLWLRHRQAPRRLTARRRGPRGRRPAPRPRRHRRRAASASSASSGASARPSASCSTSCSPTTSTTTCRRSRSPVAASSSARCPSGSPASSACST